MLDIYYLYFSKINQFKRYIFNYIYSFNDYKKYIKKYLL